MSISVPMSMTISVLMSVLLGFFVNAAQLPRGNDSKLLIPGYQVWVAQEPANYYIARTTCLSKGGKLFEPHSSDDINIMSHVAQLNEVDNIWTNFVRCLPDGLHNYYFSDPETQQYKPEKIWFENGLYKVGDCVTYSTKKVVHSEHCMKLHHYVCLIAV